MHTARAKAPEGIPEMMQLFAQLATRDPTGEQPTQTPLKQESAAPPATTPTTLGVATTDTWQTASATPASAGSAPEWFRRTPPFGGQPLGPPPPTSSPFYPLATGKQDAGTQTDETSAGKEKTATQKTSARETTRTSSFNHSRSRSQRRRGPRRRNRSPTPPRPAPPQPLRSALKPPRPAPPQQKPATGKRKPHKHISPETFAALFPTPHAKAGSSHWPSRSPPRAKPGPAHRSQQPPPSLGTYGWVNETNADGVTILVYRRTTVRTRRCNSPKGCFWSDVRETHMLWDGAEWFPRAEWNAAEVIPQ